MFLDSTLAHNQVKHGNKVSMKFQQAYSLYSGMKMMDQEKTWAVWYKLIEFGSIGIWKPPLNVLYHTSNMESTRVPCEWLLRQYGWYFNIHHYPCIPSTIASFLTLKNCQYRGLTTYNADILTDWTTVIELHMLLNYLKCSQSYVSLLTFENSLHELSTGIEPNDWPLFTESSFQSIKYVLLYSGNQYPSIPFGHSEHIQLSCEDADLYAKDTGLRANTSFQSHRMWGTNLW